MISVSAMYSPDAEFFSISHDKEPLSYDHSCPDMGSGLNTTAANCRRRQSRGGGCFKKECAAAIPIPKPAPVVMVGRCKCGKEHLPKARLDRYKIDDFLCQECADDFRHKRKQESKAREYAKNFEKRKKKNQEYRKKKRAELKAARAAIDRKLAALE